MDIDGGSFRAGVKRITGRIGAFRPFGAGYEDIKDISGCFKREQA